MERQRYKSYNKTPNSKCICFPSSAVWLRILDDIRKTGRRRIDSFEPWCWRRLQQISWTARITNKSVIEEIKFTSNNATRSCNNEATIAMFRSYHAKRNIWKTPLCWDGWRYGGTRKRGRPRARWLDDTGKDKDKDRDGLLPRSEYMEFGCRGVHHTYIHTYT